MPHMSLYATLDALNPQKLILLLENIKDPIKLHTMMSEPVQKETTINYIGVVSNLNCLQYLLGNMINTFEDEDIDDMRRMFIILVNKASPDLLKSRDTLNNNILHYLAVIGDCDLVRIIIEKGVEVCVNSQKKLPHHYCKEEKCKKILINWSKIRSQAKKDILGSRDTQSSEESSNYVSECRLEDKSTNSYTDNLVTISDKSGDRKIFDKCGFVDIPDKKLTNQYVENNDLKKKKEKGMDNYQIRKIDISGIHQKKCYEIEPEEIKIKKYPGKLYISTQNIIGYFSAREDIDFISLCVIVNHEVKNSKKIKPGANIDLDEIFSFTLTEPEAKIKLYLLAEFTDFLFKKSETRKIMQSKVLHITPKNIDKCHNNFLSYDFEWLSYTTKSLFKNLKDLFSTKMPTATLLKSHISYISEEELTHINSEIPHSTKSLVSWLIFRRNSYVVWFRGYANVRGDCRMVTHLWRRRFVQWHGYKLMFFNEFSGVMVGTIDISNAKFLCDDDSKKISENTVKLILEDGMVEVQFDNHEKYNIAKCALDKCIGALSND